MPGGLQPKPPSPEIRLVVRAWNLMGGIDWAALPVIADMLGFRDIERLVVQLVAIRDAQNVQES